MKFILSIELGNAAMQTASDIGDALHKAASKIIQGGSVRQPEVGDGGSIYDHNGNRVGGWHVSQD